MRKTLLQKKYIKRARNIKGFDQGVGKRGLGIHIKYINYRYDIKNLDLPLDLL